MGERKVLNKYYPPDFDVALLKRFGQRNTGYDPFKQIEVRMMLPFSVQCTKCGEFSYRGKKFNSKKENTGEDYMGIKKVRFYMKCGVCSNIFSIKTDPKNGDYEVEFGVTRNFESWMKAKEEDERDAAEQAAEEEGDSMKALENRTLAQKRESDITDALDEMMALNKRNETVDVDALLKERSGQKSAKAKAEEAAAEAAADAKALAEAAAAFEERKKTFKRLDDDDDESANGDGSKKNKWVSMFSKPKGNTLGGKVGSKRKISAVAKSSCSASSADKNNVSATSELHNAGLNAGGSIVVTRRAGDTDEHPKKSKRKKKKKKKKKIKDKDKDKDKTSVVTEKSAVGKAGKELGQVSESTLQKTDDASSNSKASSSGLGALGDYGSSSDDS